MKWLILLMLVACGKHEQPPAVDARDSDGDQIANYEESQDEKFIANVEPMGKITGVMKLQLDTHKVIPFSNGIDFTERFLVGKEELSQKEDYFTEWAKVVFKQPIGTFKLDQPQYTMVLSFDSSENKPESVTLVTEEKEIKLGDWSPVMTIQVSKENLELLLSNKAYLNFRKSFDKRIYYQESSDQTIKKKTYRVYYSDGNESKVYYVSKDWDIPQVTTFFGISQYQNISDMNLFHLGRDRASRWFVREFQSGDMVITHSSEETIRLNFDRRFSQAKSVLSRIDGKSGPALKLNNKRNAELHFEVRPVRIERLFAISHARLKHVDRDQGGRNGAIVNYKCNHEIRSITQETQVEVSEEDVLNSISFVSGQTVIPVDKGNFEIKQMVDEKGSFFKVTLYAGLENIQLQVNPRANDTYVQIGDLAITACDMGYFAQPQWRLVNSEAKLSFDVQSYVENNP